MYSNVDTLSCSVDRIVVFDISTLMSMVNAIKGAIYSQTNNSRQAYVCRSLKSLNRDRGFQRKAHKFL
jgi:hypothetical protein